MNRKIASILAVTISVALSMTAIAKDLDSQASVQTDTKEAGKSDKPKHCQLEDLAKKCCDTEKSGIKCIEELITVIQDAKASKKKKVKDEALDKALAVLEKLKKNSEATVCAMQTIEQRNKLLKGKVEKIKKELGVVESLFNTPVSEPFMSGPYF